MRRKTKSLVSKKSMSGSRLSLAEKKFEKMKDFDSNITKIVQFTTCKLNCVLVTSLFSILWLVFLIAEPVEALRLKTSWGERVELSQKIIRGEVTSMKSYWNPERTLIYTDVIVRADEYLKGDGSREIVLKIPGGTVGDKTQWVSDTPQFSMGNSYVIFLESSAQVTGGPDGVYQLEGEDGDRFLHWLRAYIAGDPKACKEGAPMAPRLQPN